MQVAFNRRLRRSKVLALFSRLTPYLVGVETCASSQYWARELSRLGHPVRLMRPMYVKPNVKRDKSDAVDAEATCEAVTRPTMRFVEIIPKTGKPSCPSFTLGTLSFFSALK